MPDSNVSGVDRREFLQAGLAATAAAATLGAGGSSIGADDVKPGGKQARAPDPETRQDGHRRHAAQPRGRSSSRPRWTASSRTAYREGVRYFDTAASYGNGSAERIIGDWLAAAPEIRKTIFLATKNGVKTPGDMLKNVDERLASLKTDYIDLLFFHGLESDQTDWPKSKELKDAAEAIKKTGKVRFGRLLDPRQDDRRADP